MAMDDDEGDPCTITNESAPIQRGVSDSRRQRQHGSHMAKLRRSYLRGAKREQPHPYSPRGPMWRGCFGQDQQTLDATPMPLG